jgi:hypothetical protein
VRLGQVLAFSRLRVRIPQPRVSVMTFEIFLPKNGQQRINCWFSRNTHRFFYSERKQI